MPRADRERQMLAVAEEVFAERGYAATSMDDIAERVGVSKPMIYEYFRSKEGLLTACIRHARAELRDATARAVAAAGSREDAVRLGLHAYFRFITDRRQSWSLLRNEAALTGSAAAEEVEAVRRQQTDLMAELFADYFPGDDPLRPEAVAEGVVGACERIGIWCERHPEVTPEGATSYAMDMIWAGMGARPSPSETP
jgi:AcrR family transcriptional regulator